MRIDLGWAFVKTVASTATYGNQQGKTCTEIGNFVLGRSICVRGLVHAKVHVRSWAFRWRHVHS